MARCSRPRCKNRVRKSSNPLLDSAPKTCGMHEDEFQGNNPWRGQRKKQRHHKKVGFNVSNRV